MRKLLIILILCLSGNTLMAKKDEIKEAGQGSYKNVISFENEGEQQFWKSELNKIGISDKHFKHGNKSLEWSFGKREHLWITHPDIVKATVSKNGGMKAWIYNETPIEGELTIKVGNKTLLANNKAPYQFGFRLNFTGWRAFWVHFREDAVTEAGQLVPDNLDIVEVTAPQTAGIIFWDNVEFPDELSWKRSDDHFKVINNEIDHFGVNHPWKYTNFWSKQPVASAKGLSWTTQSENDFLAIEKRYLDWVLGETTGNDYEPFRIRRKALDKLITEAKAVFASLNIRQANDGTLIGEPLYTLRGGHRPLFADLSMKVLLQLTLDYKLNGDRKSLDNCLLALDYMHDQGWAPGSALGTIDHELLRHAGYFHTIFLLKKELKETRRLSREIETAKWFLNWGELYNMPEYVGCTADFMRSVFLYRLLVILSQESGSEKLRDMNYYCKWINNSMRIATGFADTFKPDFTGYHHRGIYMNAYSPGAFHLAAVVVYFLHKTGFEVHAEGVENLRKALKTARIMSCKYSIPLGVCGRFPEKTTNFADILPAMAYLLKANPDDDEMLGYYKDWWEPQSKLFKEELFSRADSKLSFYHTLGAIQIMNEVAALKGAATSTIEGNWFKPYAGLAVHRRSNWMVTAKGWSSYIWDFESGKGENVFGRYESYGALQFFTAGTPVNDRASGYNPAKGWDWSRIPGTTAIHLPLREMEHKKGEKNIAYQEGKHRNFTNQTFLGGVSSSKDNGVFANKIHDNVFNPSFKARKSVFFFDHLIVCLGDGIQNNDEKHNTETTLFQIDDNGGMLKANNEVIGKGEFESGKKTVFIAPDNNTYIVPKDQQVRYHYRKQESIEESGVKTTKGDYFTAWIDHGKAPVNGQYEYAVVIGNNMHRFRADSVNYTVLQQDWEAHVVQYDDETGYVVWDSDFENKEGAFSSVSTPGIVMITKTDNGIDLAFTDPDLRRPKLLNTSGMPHENVIAPSYPQTVRITLNGMYKIKSSDSMNLVGYFNNKTILEVICVDGKGYHASLTKADK